MSNYFECLKQHIKQHELQIKKICKLIEPYIPKTNYNSINDFLAANEKVPESVYNEMDLVYSEASMEDPRNICPDLYKEATKNMNNIERENFDTSLGMFLGHHIAVEYCGYSIDYTKDEL